MSVSLCVKSKRKDYNASVSFTNFENGDEGDNKCIQQSFSKFTSSPKNGTKTSTPNDLQNFIII